jgi:hypothetical protein
MKTAGSNAHNRRPNSSETGNRLTRFLSGLKKINPIKSSTSTRSREQLRNQLTIEFLRYRLTHSDAMLQYAGHAVYSEAFTRFLLKRYHETAQELSPEQFAEAAEVPVELLHQWLEQAQNPASPITEEAMPALRVSAHFEKWLSVTRDFLHATGDEFGWRATQIKHILTKVVRLMIRLLPKRLTFRHYEKIAALTPAALLFNGYGFQSLRQSYQKNLSRGLMFSITIHFLALGFYSILDVITEEETPPKTVRIMLYPELENTIAEKQHRARTAEMGEGRQPRGNKNEASVSPFGITTQSNLLLPLRVMPADYATQPPGPNISDDALKSEVPIIDVAGLQELVNQGIPSSIAGTGDTPLVHFVPKSGENPKIDLASVGGENGFFLPSSSTPGGQGRVLYASTIGEGFNPSFQAAGGGLGSGKPASGYRTARTGSLPEGGDAGNRNSRSGRTAINHQAEPSYPDRIPLKNVGENDWKNRDLKKLFYELFEWMETNRHDFPPALKHYMRFKDGDVTSRVEIATVENHYELFLLCNKSSEDFGLLLVAAGDSAQAICLRDTGFRKQSLYLSKGIAGRNESAAIGSVSMLEQRPTFQETSRFYNIFLSWWDKTKAGDAKKS